MLKLSPAVSLKTTLRERSAAQDVRLTHPRLRRCCRKKKRDIRINKLVRGLFMDSLLRQSC